MKKIILGAATVGALFAVTGCASGVVVDKRAPGVPGDKTYEVRIVDDRLVGPDDIWVKVSETEWDKCDVEETFPCTG